MPDEYPEYSSSVNAILGQANIQMQLVGTGIHVLSAGESNNMNTTYCTFDWEGTGPSRYNVGNAVDLYSIESFSNAIEPQPLVTGWGGGNCRMKGHLAVKDIQFEMSDHHYVAIQVDHEFGHYLGGLGHNNTTENLMDLSGQGGHVLTSGQEEQAQLSISGFVHTDPSTDFNKHN